MAGRTAACVCVCGGVSDDHVEEHFVKQLRTEFCISKERASLADVHLPGAMTQPLLWPSGGSRNSDFYLEVVTLNLEAWRTCWGWG